MADFSRLPTELVALVLHFASGVDEVTRESRAIETKVIKQICYLKLVCSTFADIGDGLLFKVDRVTHALFSLRFEPTQKCLDMIRAVSKNVKLSLMIQCLGDHRKPDWLRVVPALEGIDELPKALACFPRLHSIDCWKFPTHSDAQPRLEEVTALFTEWLMIAAAAVSASPTDGRPLSIGLTRFLSTFFAAGRCNQWT